jgi:hypothetical protein
MILEHYTSKPFNGPYSILPAMSHYGCPIGDKPMGLWVSVKGEDDWPSWCNGENFCEIWNKRVFEIQLMPNHNILIIDDASKFVNFHKMFSEFPARSTQASDCFKMINWERVGRVCKGIIIAPYLWSCRIDYMWYYGWDCASGCIWDASAIQSWKEIPNAHSNSEEESAQAC